MNRKALQALLVLVILFGFPAASDAGEAGQSRGAAMLTPEAIVDATIRDGQTTTGKVRAVIEWTHDHLDWTDTDYVKRSLEDILKRGGGNCFEQAVVVVAALDRAGVKTRKTREINIQPASDERQRNAEERIAASGDAASVFGRRHNDHVWIEYWNEESKEWAPADPTLNIVGYDEWVKARMGYGRRPVNDIIASRDMLVPIAVFAVDTGGRLVDRSRRYLIDGFAVYNPAAPGRPEWMQWTADIETFSADAALAFEGHYNLHQDEGLIAELEKVYRALKPNRR